MGMEIEAQDGPATYLRGWGDYQRWSLKPHCGRDERHGRPWPPRLEPRSTRAPRGRDRNNRPRRRLWTDGDLGRGPSYRFRDPEGHLFEIYYDCERYEPADGARSVMRR